MEKYYYCGDSEYDHIEVNKNTKFGFVCIEFDFNLVCHVGFNSAKEYAEELGADEYEFEKLEDLQVGQSTYLGDYMYVRLW